LQCGPLKDGGAFYFIDMELCDFTLHQYMQGQDIEGIDNWNTIRQQDSAIERGYDILLHITNGLLYIHCLREVHRDLSPQNGITLETSFRLTA
jgi:serine/threonine protein kinase